MAPTAPVSAGAVRFQVRTRAGRQTGVRIAAMGVFRYRIGVAATEDGPFEETEPIVDTGSMYTWMPATLLERLGVRAVDRPSSVTADGRAIGRDVGRLWVEVDGRKEITLVVFGGESDQILLGAYTLEGLALAVDPINRRLVPMSSIPAMSVLAAEGVRHGLS